MASISSSGTKSPARKESPLSEARCTNTSRAAGEGPFVIINTAASTAMTAQASVTPTKAKTLPATRPAPPSSSCILSSLLIFLLPSVRVLSYLLKYSSLALPSPSSTQLQQPCSNQRRFTAESGISRSSIMMVESGPLCATSRVS